MQATTTLCKLFIASCVLLLAATAIAAEQQAAHIVAVGEGEVSIPPDMALLSLTVTREASTARAALDANSSAMEEVIAAMRAAGIAERDLQTSGFSIQPRHVFPQPRGEKPPQLVGYTVRNSLTVKVRDLDGLGALLDESVSLGVNEGGNVRFTNDDPSAALARAREAAVVDALARARGMARAAGVKAGRILQISEAGPVHGPRPVMERMAMAQATASVPLAAGENTYRVAVTVTVAIEQ